MTPLSACRAIAPLAWCEHANLMAYLLPALGLAVIIRILSKTHPAFFIFTLAGTICHELAHFIAGFLVGARPASLTVVPRRHGRQWRLGAVALTRVRWWNAAPAALAPLALLAIPLAAAWWRTRSGFQFGWADAGLAFLLAPQFLSFWPSSSDWKIAARSWPCLILIPLITWACFKM
jgi:hypothetical protein